MKKENEIFPNLFEHRLILLLEQDDGKFYQVGLTQEQFKKVGDVMIKAKHEDPDLKEGYEMVEFDLNPDWSIDADLFIGLESFYEETTNL